MCSSDEKDSDILHGLDQQICVIGRRRVSTWISACHHLNKAKVKFKGNDVVNLLVYDNVVGKAKLHSTNGTDNICHCLHEVNLKLPYDRNCLS